jgi:hypothetical protein
MCFPSLGLLRFNFVFGCYAGAVMGKTSSSGSSAKRGAQLRAIGAVVLLLGLGGAGLVYWRGTRSPNVSDDISMVGFNRARQRQMGQLYGKMGLLIEEWVDDLKQPGTQAAIIAALSTLTVAGCFYFARFSDK